MQTITEFLFRKKVLIVISFIYLINGIDLLLVGIKTKTKRWIIAGTTYILLESGFLIIGNSLGIIFSVATFVCCLVHTIYVIKKHFDSFSDMSADKTPELPSFEATTIRLPIEKSSIEYDEAGNLKIIISSKGEYEFISDGTSITEARMFDGTVNKYE